MRVLGLFSGIGGFELGLQRAGMTISAMCEIDPFCRRVLARHWPGVPIYEDVRELTADRLARDGIEPDLICGGFPCQDISTARAAAAPGLAGERSGLWADMLRLVRDVRPDWVLAENVARLRTLGADRVLGDLAATGYTARPLVVGAENLGAPHPRKRVWIIADADRGELWQQPRRRSRPSRADPLQPARHDAHADRQGEPAMPEHGEMAGRAGIHGAGFALWERQAGTISAHSMDDGLPAGLDAGLRAYGNAVLPQIPEILGRAIIATAGA